VEIGQNRNPPRDAGAPESTHEFAAQKPGSNIERSRRGRRAVLQRPSKKIDSRDAFLEHYKPRFVSPSSMLNKGVFATTWDEKLSSRSSGKGG
jgi:hypothetical protein